MINSIINGFDIWTDAQGVKSKGRVKSIDNISLGGIAKLRELILDLAIHGKLVPQKHDENSVEDLFKKLNSARDKLIKEGKIKKYKSKTNEVNVDNSIKLPNNWKVTSLIEVFDVRDGTHDSPKYQSEGYPLITSKNLFSGHLDFNDVNYISEIDHLKISERSKVERYDILFAMIGSIGNPVIVDTDREFSIKNVALFKYYDKELSCPEFLQIFLRHATVEMKAKALGGVQSFVSLGMIREFKFYLPPLEEQKRIVEKVIELMSLCDKLEEEQTKNLTTHRHLVKCLLETLTQANDADELQSSWEKISQHFDTLFCTEDSIELLKKTILQLAIMGKLEKPDPNEVPSNFTIEKIIRTKDKLIKEGKLKKMSPLPEVSPDEIPFALPKKWAWVRLGEVTNYGFSEKVEPGSVDEHTWVLELEDIEKESSKLLQKIRVSDKNFKSSKNRFYKGDVVYGKLRPYLDKVIIADENGVCTTEMIPFSGYMDISSEYLKLVLKSTYFIDYATNSTHGMNLPRLGTEKARMALLPLAPFNEQKRIVNKVDELFSICDLLKERISKSEAIKNTLSNTIIELG